MKYITLLSSYIFVFLPLCCSQVAAQEAPISQLPDSTNYRIRVSRPDAAQLKVGDVAELFTTIKNQRDSVLNTSRNTGPFQIPVRDPGELHSGLNPIEAVLSRLRAGEVAELLIDIGQFGNRPPGTREGDTIVIYELEIVRVLSAEEYEAEKSSKQEEAAATRKLVQAREAEAIAVHEATLAAFREGTLSGVITTASGLQYVILQRGDGELPAVGEDISVNYIGALTDDGTVFDQSFVRGEGIDFPVGKGVVIPGWDEGLQLLPHGSHAVLFIPAKLAYGERGVGGNIPPNADLTFYVELD